MNEWYQSVWGIITLGAIGSILGVFLIWIFKGIIDKFGPKLFLNFLSSFLKDFAANQYFVEKCEKERRYDLIVMNHFVDQSRLFRLQIVFIINFVITFLFCIAYVKVKTTPIYMPLIFSIYILRPFYKFCVCYMGVSGAMPRQAKKIYAEIASEFKNDKHKFISEAMEKFNV